MPNNREFRLVALARDLGNRRGEITVYSEIYPYSYGDSDPTVSSNKFIKELNSLDVDEITVRINSPGGVVTEAIAIRTALMKHPARKIIDIEGCCDSAATLIACMPGARVRMAKGGEYMIHCCSGGVRGNAEKVLSCYNSMVQTDKDIAAIYAERTGKSADECMALMKAETWYGAQEAMDAGFVDEIITGSEGDEPISACAVSTETMDLMRACYAHVPERPVREDAPAALQSVAAAGSATLGTEGSASAGSACAPAQRRDCYEHVSNGSAEDTAEAVPSENTANAEGVNHMEIRDVTAEQLRQENPALAQSIEIDAVKAERERVAQINALTRKGEKWAAMAKKAIEDGTSAADYLKAVIAEEDKTHADYLANRQNEAQQAGKVGGGDPGDHDEDVNAKIDKAAKEIADIAKGMTASTADMA